MSRRLRRFDQGSIYHVISRFVAQEWFIDSPEERRGYLSLLGLYLAASDWRCFSFAIMSNHIHLGLLAGADSLKSWLGPVHTKFAQWINERRQRIGAVFVRAQDPICVQPEGVSRLIGYIHHNPVRAGVVASPSDSDWTSHRAYVGVGYKQSWLDVDLGLELAGFCGVAAFDSWTNRTTVTRSDLEAFSVNPPRPVGRPPSETSARGQRRSRREAAYLAYAAERSATIATQASVNAPVDYDERDQSLSAGL